MYWVYSTIHTVYCDHGDYIYIYIKIKDFKQGEMHTYECIIPYVT